MADQLSDRMQRTDHDTLIRLETKVDGLPTAIREAVSELGGRITDHETRIRSMETQASTVRATMRAYSIAAGVAGTVFGFVLSIIAVISGIIHK